MWRDSARPSSSRSAMPGQCPRAPLRRRAISFSQGAEWKALISRYIGTMPLSAKPCPGEQTISMAPPPEMPVSSAMRAKLGAAASDSHWAAPRAIPSPPVAVSTGILASDAFIVMSPAPFSLRPIGRW